MTARSHGVTVSENTFSTTYVDVNAFPLLFLEGGCGEEELTNPLLFLFLRIIWPAVLNNCFLFLFY